MTPSPDIRIVIVAYNSGDYLQDCIDCLAQQTHAEIEIVIVDNGGTDRPDGLHLISLPDSRFSHWHSPENSGFSGGLHWGSDSAATKWIMSVNPDTMLDRDCIEKLLEAAATCDDPEMLSPRLYSDGTREKLDGVGDTLSAAGMAWRNAYGANANKLNMDPITEVFSPTGAAALYLRKAYEQAGGIDPIFFCYMEDIDLGLRIRGHGGLCIQVNAATGVHSGGHSTDSIAGFAIRHSARNALLMIVSSAPLLLLLPLLVTHIIGQSWLQWRNRGTETAAYRKAGYKESLKLLPKVFANRFKRKIYPLGASFRILTRLSWKLSDLRNRPARFWSL